MFAHLGRVFWSYCDPPKLQYKIKKCMECGNKIGENREKLFCTECDVNIEKKLHDSEFLNFHPLINTVTITISTNNFIKFMIENKKKIHIFSSIEGLIIKTYE